MTEAQSNRWQKPAIYLTEHMETQGIGSKEFLAGFEKGTIQSDAYTVYELLTNGNKKLKRVLCWAHVRNSFESAFLSAKDKIADWFVKKIAELYRIENITHVVKEIINGNTNYETLVPWAIKLA